MFRRRGVPRKAKIVISDTHIGAGSGAEGNRLEDFISGNHDPELAYPGVQARLAEMVAAVDEKAHLVAIGRRTYFQDGVYIEHGNAYTESVDQFQDPDSPFDPRDPGRVEHPSGSPTPSRTSSTRSNGSAPYRWHTSCDCPDLLRFRL